MSTFLCLGDEKQKHRSPVDDENDYVGASSMSSVLNVSTPNACTSHCQLFQEIPEEDVSDRRPLEDVEKLIAKDLIQVSHKERQDALEDIHGVSDIPEEAPESVVKYKNDLEVYLIQNQKQSSAFHIAWNVAPSYVRSLYLKFLRCDAFDIQKAGQRIYLHFDTKLWLFGEDKLYRDITLADLDSNDMDCYQAGTYERGAWYNTQVE
jgi:hypothetical protein